MKSNRFIISGGGTGGHIFPAISIANTIKELQPDAEILFVGAENRMEMEKVPAAGYKIVGLPVAGFQRKLTLKNVGVVFKLIRSLLKARKVVSDFKPDVAIGVGGYASGPVLKQAANKGIPCLVQEQNSYAGVTNRLLAKKAQTICVAYDKMERFFPAEKIILTGNPIRNDLHNIDAKQGEARAHFNLSKDKKVLLIVGGSLGARTLNNSVLNHLELLDNSDVEIIWQTGKFYYKEIKETLKGTEHPNLHPMEFIPRMDLAFAAADLVISRAGAGTISELCVVKKPAILVPSPNVAEDHQTSNAMSLVEKGAAKLVKDNEACEKLMPTAINLLEDEDKLKNLSKNIEKLAKPDAARQIVQEIFKLI